MVGGKSSRKDIKSFLLCSSETLSQRTAVAMTPAVLNKYFDLLEDTVKGNDLHKMPALIFNCDEIGFLLVHQPEKRIIGKGQKHVLTATSDSKSRVVCVNVARYAIPPMLVLTLQSYCIGQCTCFVTW